MGYVTLASLILYVAFFAISLGPVSRLLISEVFPLRLRGADEGVPSFFSWSANRPVSLTFLSAIQRFGEADGFWAFGVFPLIAVASIHFRVPETTGRSSEEFESDLRENTVVGADADGRADSPESEGGDRRDVAPDPSRRTERPGRPTDRRRTDSATARTRGWPGSAASP